jgi:alcohol dehydrogenase
MNFSPFFVSRLPAIVFGVGSLARVPALVRESGTRLLLVRGRRSLCATPHWARLTQALQGAGVVVQEWVVAGEPSPQAVDAAVREFRPQGIEVVLGIGGGSVLDAAKAVAGLLPHGNSVLDHLEGVGPERPYLGPATPFIAIPTTAGTGSEATKNAVLSVQGPQGYKKSFRHELLVPRYAVVDPDLLACCPPDLIAANGMDALTQLLESYVSSKAHPLSDALAWDGLTAVRAGLLPWYEQGAGAVEGRAAMAYAALLSGITLAQVGLGSVHGLAAPLGSLFPVPHGVACGRLVAAATRLNIEALQARAPAHAALQKYAQVGRLLCGDPRLSDPAAQAALVDLLSDWTERMRLPRLGYYGIREADLASLVAGSRGNSMKTNPILLEDAELRALLTRCL